MQLQFRASGKTASSPEVPTTHPLIQSLFPPPNLPPSALHGLFYKRNFTRIRAIPPTDSISATQQAFSSTEDRKTQLKHQQKPSDVIGTGPSFMNQAVASTCAGGSGPAPHYEPPLRVFQFAGATNTGKTKALLQICAFYVLPKSLHGHAFGGQEQQVVWIDCDASSRFEIHTLTTILQSYIHDFGKRKNVTEFYNQPEVQKSIIKDCLARISIYQPTDTMALAILLSSLRTSSNFSSKDLSTRQVIFIDNLGIWFPLDRVSSSEFYTRYLITIMRNLLDEYPSLEVFISRPLLFPITKCFTVSVESKACPPRCSCCPVSKTMQSSSSSSASWSSSAFKAKMVHNTLLLPIPEFTDYFPAAFTSLVHLTFFMFHSSESNSFTQENINHTYNRQSSSSQSLQGPRKFLFSAVFLRPRQVSETVKLTLDNLVCLTRAFWTKRALAFKEAKILAS